MRSTSPVILGLAVCVTLCIASSGAAQPLERPAIHRVTVRSDTGVLTITGSGLGPDLQVMVDGMPVPQLPGATATQVEALAPATVLTLPGTYRLTVLDPVHHVGDGFVVTGPSASVIARSDVVRAASAAATAGMPTAGGALHRGGAPPVT
ncbi:MAG: hypothetical protein AB7O93_17290 [Vicinamibacterales bacterium]